MDDCHHQFQDSDAHDTPNTPGDPDHVPLVCRNNNTVTQGPTADPKTAQELVTDVENDDQEPSQEEQGIILYYNRLIQVIDIISSTVAEYYKRTFFEDFFPQP